MSTKILCGKVYNLYPLEKSMNIPGWAALILAACIVCSNGKIDQFNSIHNIDDNSITQPPENRDFSRESTSTTDSGDGQVENEEENFGLKVGRTINVFPRYGSLTLTLKVMPFRFNGFNENWLFREKSAEIFQPNSYWAKYSGSNKAGGFDDHFLIDFCDTSKDLYAAYFDHFKIEGIPETYKAFTSFLSNKSKAQALGIYSTYLNSDDFSFVLVRLFRRETRTVLDGDLRLSPEFVNASQRIRIGSTESAHQFMDNFGSHVIVEYELGDVIYQVFVFGQGIYNELKTTFALSYEEAKRNFTAYNQSPSELLNIKSYFTPYFAMHVGQVKMASVKS
ncbi:Torso-like protein [Armadillidium nasatum]|uniref:Torso-like protein n=1 Tax=Armadillidium nasatum TaxID=96803 RepID=A0A5N5TGL9_9CRUS|nr:Torso-like protein [Armadillidium nasatum]